MKTKPDIMESMESAASSSGERSGLSRRDLIRGVSLGALGLATAGGLAKVSTANVWAADTPPPKTTDGLEDFVFDIENASGAWRGKGGSATEATVEEFPISQSIAGVSMRLNPGGYRELHWHSIAGEWAYVLEGRVRTTVISPEGTAATDDFEVGDIWYFPKGHGHMLQCLGDKPCHFLLGFDNGHFSEFGTFSVTDWVSHTRPDIIARNLGIPADALEGLPKKELYIGSGPVAGEVKPKSIVPGQEPSQNPHKFSLLQAPAEEFAGGTLRIVSQKQFPINTTLTSALMTIKPGALREMHWHPNADEWQFVIGGTGRVTIFGSHGRVKTMGYGPGKIAFIKQGYGHFIENSGDEELRILILFNSPEYQEIALRSWLGANSSQLVADHFGIDSKWLASFPNNSLGIVPPPPGTGATR